MNTTAFVARMRRAGFSPELEHNVAKRYSFCSIVNYTPGMSDDEKLKVFATEHIKLVYLHDCSLAKKASLANQYSCIMGFIREGKKPARISQRSSLHNAARNAISDVLNAPDASGQRIIELPDDVLAIEASHEDDVHLAIEDRYDRLTIEDRYARLAIEDRPAPHAISDAQWVELMHEVFERIMAFVEVYAPFAQNPSDEAMAAIRGWPGYDYLSDEAIDAYVKTLEEFKAAEQSTLSLILDETVEIKFSVWDELHYAYVVTGLAHIMEEVFKTHTLNQTRE